jgi:polar amino acid transport system substrate-binding protein
MRNLHGLLPLGTIALALTVASLSVPRTAYADQAGCDPAKLAAKYPALAGKTIKIGQDGESVPFSQRDPKDFNKLIGLDADLARATFACVGVPIDFTIGA